MGGRRVVVGGGGWWLVVARGGVWWWWVVVFPDCCLEIRSGRSQNVKIVAGELPEAFPFRFVPKRTTGERELF